MNKNLRNLMYLLVIIMLFIVGSSEVIASKGDVEYWQQLTTEDRFKEWNIKFNHPVNQYSVHHGNVILTDEDENIYTTTDIEVILKDDYTIGIIPKMASGYDRNKMYYINLKQTLYSTNNKRLDKELIVPFMVDSASNNSFMLSEISIGDKVEKLIAILGQPKRIDLSGKKYEWYIYNEDYKDYMQIGVYKDKVVSIYSAKESLLPDYGINLKMHKSEVEKIFSKETKYVNGSIDGDKYIIGDNIITFYYDNYKNDELISIWVEDLDHASTYPNITDDVMKDFEKQSFDLTNVARVQNNRNAYLWNEEAANTARRHSKDMAKYGYVGHTDSSGNGPRQRANDDNVDFRNISENVAGGYPGAIEVHHGWMESEGHRGNILTFLKELGVGVAKSSHETSLGYIPFYTQLFITPSHYEFEDEEFVDNNIDFNEFTISEENREKSIIYNYTSEPNIDYPGIIDVLDVELVFYQDYYNFTLELRDVPKEITINNTTSENFEPEYAWAIIIESDTDEYIFSCHNKRLWDDEKIVLVENLNKHFRYDIYSREKGSEEYVNSTGILSFLFDSKDNTLKFHGMKGQQFDVNNIKEIKFVGISTEGGKKVLVEDILKND